MDICIRPLTDSDLQQADHIFRLAFGTFLGLPDPMTFAGDADYVKSRFHANPSAAYAAEDNGKLVGSNFTTNWGSVGFFGPLTIHPEYWNQGVAQKLLEPTMKLFDKWNTKYAGLFTFANSPKHIGLYQKFNFWPRFLTVIMSKDVRHNHNNNKSSLKWSKFSELFNKKELGDTEQYQQEQAKYLSVCRRLTNTIYNGLDLSIEILSADKQQLGDTVLLWKEHDNNNDDINITPIGLAVCHFGPGSEAGSNTCYIKFGAVKPGPDAGNDFERLLDACEALAAEKEMTHLIAGVNTSRYNAYRKMLSKGFRSDKTGIVMQRNNESGYNRPDVYAIDDWR
jgi:GNAT superfamily N-acetyltransferase